MESCRTVIFSQQRIVIVSVIVSEVGVQLWNMNTIIKPASVYSSGRNVTMGWDNNIMIKTYSYHLLVVT